MTDFTPIAGTLLHRRELQVEHTLTLRRTRTQVITSLSKGYEQTGSRTFKLVEELLGLRTTIVTALAAKELETTRNCSASARRLLLLVWRVSLTARPVVHPIRLG